MDATIEYIDVNAPEAAEQLRFLGSPSVRVDGEDVEPPANCRGEYGLMCRTYGFGSEAPGKPRMAMIRAAIRRGIAADLARKDLIMLNATNQPSRKSESTNSASRDILSNVPLTALLFWLPIIVLLASGFFQIGQGWRTAVWVVALAIVGASCVANALRCGRVHCYATGPFFLGMAAVALLYGLGVIPLGTNGWNFIGAAVLVGALVLCCVPEALLGKYR